MILVWYVFNDLSICAVFRSCLIYLLLEVCELIILDIVYCVKKSVRFRDNPKVSEITKTEECRNDVNEDRI